MYICIVFAQMKNSGWKLFCLPVLEKREYSLYDWYKHLAPEDDKFCSVYMSANALSLFDVSRLVGNTSIEIETHQLKHFMKKCHDKLGVKWRKIKIKPNSMQTNDRDLFANLIWDKISGVLEGRLLHIYEVQRCLQQQRISITLEQLVHCLVVWVWRDAIQLQTGIEVMKRHRWVSMFGLQVYDYQCRRCLSKRLERAKYICHSCHDQCLSCTDCTQLGKVRSCSILIKVKRNLISTTRMEEHVDKQSIISQYKLSDAQTSAVEQLIDAIVMHYKGVKHESSKARRNTKLNYILWAVTGAGKTEMIFPLIHLFLEQGLNVLIAIPRRDVVQELQPRISQAFQDKKVVALYGGSEQIWEEGQIYIATTHQIIRFDQYFDLVILDEMDAFPYYNNESLLRTIRRVQNKHACFVQLTATIPAKEKMNILLKRQQHVKVPVRYHQKALPIPQFKKTPSLLSILHSNQLPTVLLNIIDQSSRRGAVLFIFLQRKSYLQSFTQILKNSFPSLAIDCTSAEDEHRENKVKLFRERKITILVTTSILERGVTIKRSDICIMDVHQKAYNRTAIVQMSGRAGRSVEDTKGFVYLLGTHKTKQVSAAIKEIKAMNLLAKRKGYLKEEGL